MGDPREIVERLVNLSPISIRTVSPLNEAYPLPPPNTRSERRVGGSIVRPAENGSTKKRVSAHGIGRSARGRSNKTRATTQYLLSRVGNALGVLAGDWAALAFAGIMTGLLVPTGLSPNVGPGWLPVVLALWTGLAVGLDLTPGWSLGPVGRVRRLSTGLTALVGALLLPALMAGEIAVATLLGAVLFWIVALVGLGLTRSMSRRVLERMDWWGVNAVVFGSRHRVREIAALLENRHDLGYHPIAVCPTENSRNGERTPTNGRRTHRSFETIDGRTEEHRSSNGKAERMAEVDEGDLSSLEAPVAFLVPDRRTDSRRPTPSLLEEPLSTFHRIMVVPDLPEMPPLLAQPSKLLGMAGFDVTLPLTNPVVRAIKRSADLLLVLATSPLWVPICAVIALAVWLEDGHSPFFFQERLGRNGRRFETCKFRTMVPDAEEVLEQYLEENEELRERWNDSFKLEEDPRVTRIGRFLRTTSLDELPQLINVLRGEMSLVGPRPLPPYHHEELSVRVQRLREQVRPGISGLWQVTGRSNSGTEGMETWDPYYVENWSLLLDGVILVKTIPAVLRGKGAH